MDIRVTKATNQQRNDALNIAKTLPEWFTPEGLLNLRSDCEKHEVFIATQDAEVKGFLCYALSPEKARLLWMGVRKDAHGRGVGRALLTQLEKECCESKIKTIEVETLPDEDPYEPYKRTREFYYKNGFKRVAYKKAEKDGWDDQIVMQKSLLS